MVKTPALTPDHLTGCSADARRCADLSIQVQMVVLRENVSSNARVTVRVILVGRNSEVPASSVTNGWAWLSDPHDAILSPLAIWSARRAVSTTATMWPRMRRTWPGYFLGFDG